jgi:hypothetical protein
MILTSSRKLSNMSYVGVQKKTLNVYWFIKYLNNCRKITDDMVCWSDTHPDVRLFHLLSRDDFPSWWWPDQVEESLLKN